MALGAKPGCNGDARLDRKAASSYRWQGYDEALLLYILGLGSPTHPLPESSYAAWASTYRWERSYGPEYFYAGPLFTHQLSHVWIDFRGTRDAFMRDKGIDYFENSRRVVASLPFAPEIVLPALDYCIHQAKLTARIVVATHAPMPHIADGLRERGLMEVGCIEQLLGAGVEAAQVSWRTGC